MKSVTAMRTEVRRFYERRRREWAQDAALTALGASAPSSPTFDRPLHPPTEREALAAMGEVNDWIREWNAFSPQTAVLWGERRWPAIGAQRVPERLALVGVAAIAEVAGVADEWQALERRIEEFVGWLHALLQKDSQLFSDDETVASALSDVVSALIKVNDDDWAITLAVLEWLALHQDIACYVRELPIRGIDTKWIEGHRGLVLPLYQALTLRKELPFLSPPALVRLRWLDSTFDFHGVLEFACPIEELARLKPLPESVIICENLVSFLSLPDIAGMAAIFGQGYAVERLRDVPWLQSASLWYWGDIDSHGFAILDGLRAYLPQVHSLMMDRETLHAFTDLCGREPVSTHQILEHLTAEEQATLAELMSVTPALRLEQERIPWDHVLAVLASLGAPYSNRECSLRRSSASEP